MGGYWTQTLSFGYRPMSELCTRQISLVEPIIAGSHEWTS